MEKNKKGHRQRLRERFLAEEEGSRSDEALLELLLTYALTRKDVHPIAQELLREFGGLSQILAELPENLEKVSGIGQSSVVLLKLVHSLTADPTLAADGDANPAKTKPHERIVPAHQTESPSDDAAIVANSENNGDEPLELVQIPSNSSFVEQGIEQSATVVPSSKKSLNTAKATSIKKKSRRKFQVCNGYLLEFDQLARVLHFLLENRDAKKISRKLIQESTGLTDRQLESLVSIGSAMGLIQPRVQTLSAVGLLIAENDIFIEKRSTLEWCHYAGAGSYRNLVWYEIFNSLLSKRGSMTRNSLTESLRSSLEGQYAARTIKKSLREEVHFVTDAYLEQNLRKLELLQQASDDRLYIRRYTSFDPLVLTAMLYDFGANKDSQLLQVDEMAVTPGSPALLFGLDAATFRQQIEGLHDKGWLRYETTHNLDQVRLKPSFSALEFLTAHFHDREPREGATPVAGGVSQ